MRIIVFIKTVKFVYAQTGTDPKKNFVGPDDIIHIINPFDELAVEEALQIKEKYEDTEIVVISFGDHFAEEGLRKCLSMGVDKAVHLYAEDSEKMDPWATAMSLAYSVRNLPFELILCGREAIDDQAGLVGPYIAEILKIFCVSKVIKIEMDRVNSQVLLQRALERGNREKIVCKIPALLTIERSIKIPRYPTLPGILRAQHQVIEKLELENLKLPMDPFDSALHLLETISLSPPKPMRRAKSSEDSKLSASDRLKSLMKGGDSTKKEDSKVLEGGSGGVLEEFERVLKENGIAFE